jgi:RNA polymerase sigma factor (sigma-70 family)
MTDTLDTDRENADWHRQGMTDGPVDLHAWFLREVLPLEAVLTQFLGHHCRGQTSVADLLQDVYVRVYEAARKQFPENTKSFVFTTAHNLLVDRVRREKIIPIEAVENLEALGIAAEGPGPEAHAEARDELRRLQAALEHVAPRAREAFVLHHAGGLKPGEIAVRMNISVKTVSYHLNEAVQTLTDILYGTQPGRRTKS